MADTTHTVEQDIARIKEDIASLKTDMGRVKEDITSLKTDMAVIKAEMKGFATKEDLQMVRAEIEHMGRTLIMWNVSSMIALAGIVVAIVRFMK